MAHLTLRDLKNLRAHRREYSLCSSQGKKVRTISFMKRRLWNDPIVHPYVSTAIRDANGLRLWGDVKDALAISQGMRDISDHHLDNVDDIIPFREAVRTHPTSKCLTRLCGYDWYSLADAGIRMSDSDRLSLYKMTRNFSKYELIGLRVSRPHT